ncbi:MAG: 3-deoxy-D-manno-octulosonic acid transferase [Limisphaerales bacterium]
MRSLYNFLFLIGFGLSAPFYFLKMWRRGNWKAGFEQRFAIYSSKLKQALTNRHVIWIHAVSVGEVNICIELIRSLEKRLPNIKIVVSTTTSTGMGELQKKLPAHIDKIYYPIDRRKFVRRALSTIHPEAIILVEAEIWPNFLWHAADLEIPVFLVNARLSERSYKGYRRFGFLFRKLFAQFAGVGCQNETDATRLRELGFQSEAVRVVGNLKFDAAKLDDKKQLDVRRILHQVGVPEDALILLGGSTHAGEEQILGEIYRKLKRQFPRLFLVVVPRHFERSKEVARQLEGVGLKLVYRTELTADTKHVPGSVDCLLVNTTGELRFFYEHADLIFVGKSLTADGGQNPIEPGALGKAMIFGPNMQNFLPISNAFLTKGGAVQVQNREELERAIADLLKDESRRKHLGGNAAAVVRENLGAIDRTVAMIAEHLGPNGIYVSKK